MSYQFYMSVVGTKQGSFKGGSPPKGSGGPSPKGGLPCHAFELTDATIVKIKPVSIPGAKGPGEEVEFTYQKLETKVQF